MMIQKIIGKSQKRTRSRRVDRKKENKHNHIRQRCKETEVGDLVIKDWETATGNLL
jgi:hypothetical protein